jgi:hypothetical protein
MSDEQIKAAIAAAREMLEERPGDGASFANASRNALLKM